MISEEEYSSIKSSNYYKILKAFLEEINQMELLNEFMIPSQMLHVYPSRTIPKEIKNKINDL